MVDNIVYQINTIHMDGCECIYFCYHDTCDILFLIFQRYLTVLTSIF